MKSLAMKYFIFLVCLVALWTSTGVEAGFSIRHEYDFYEVLKDCVAIHTDVSDQVLDKFMGNPSWFADSALLGEAFIFLQGLPKSSVGVAYNVTHDQIDEVFACSLDALDASYQSVATTADVGGSLWAIIVPTSILYIVWLTMCPYNALT